VRKSHLRPPQPLHEPPQSTRYPWATNVLLFVAAATAVLCIGALLQ